MEGLGLASSSMLFTSAWFQPMTFVQILTNFYDFPLTFHRPRAETIDRKFMKCSVVFSTIDVSPRGDSLSSEKRDGRICGERGLRRGIEAGKKQTLARWIVRTVHAIQRPINVVTGSRVREQRRFYYDYDRRVTVSTLSQLPVLVAIIRLRVIAQSKEAASILPASFFSNRRVVDLRFNYALL